MVMPLRVAICGSTGSVGTQALEVIAADPDAFDVVAIGAATSVDLLVEQAEQFRPRVVGLADRSRAVELGDRLPSATDLVAGPRALAALCDEADVVINGVVGFAGLDVTLAALEGGKRLALANKESLIAGGPVVQRARRTAGAQLVPVDSEHSALHQCLLSRGDSATSVDKLVLTASGGPFRGRTPEDLADVTIDDALAHPTWSMGPKITVDSSTLMNKGLEVIEAHELFGIGYDDIDVVVHPQSIVHSMVGFTDGSTIAQLSEPDMRLPVSYALGYPTRSRTPFGTLDWSEARTLTFEAPDRQAFPCLDLCYDAGREGGSAPAWLNAANEIAVEHFLAGRISWLQISEVLKEALTRHDGRDLTSPDVVREVDRESRRVTEEIVTQRVG